jgi:peptide/nickel transport system substrate-binding protein
MRNHQQLEDFFGIGDSSADDRESIRDTITRRLPMRTRLRLLPKVLSRRERYAVLGLAVIAALAILAIPITAFYHYTESVPTDGGKLVEGIVGEPRLVNPLLAQTNDADRDLVALMYSGLYRYNGEGRLVPDLAKSLPEITSDGLTYSVTLRDDALWHDGLSVTADDVMFTVQVAQNQDYGAPANVRGNWGGVTVERVSERVVAFHLQNKYAQFPNNLTLGLLPEHLWEDVRPINFTYAELNIKPVGSGPYRFKSLTKNDLGRIHSYKLAAFDEYYAGRPHINELEFRFFGTEDELIDAFNKNDVDNVSFVSGPNASRLKFRNRIELQRLRMPRYFALFFNQNRSRALADKNVRLALSHGTDRVGIINDILDGNGFLINSPMMGGILDINANVKSYDYDPDQAASVLNAGGWEPAEEDGVRQKADDNRIELTITTSTWSELIAVAQEIKEQWEELGVQVSIEALPVSQLQEVIRQRSYQILLFGQILSPDPDPYAIWHSSQREGIGGNLALYSNRTADRLLEEARQTLNPLERAQKYDEFQKVLIEDIPAVFLYSAHYLYGLDNNVKGFDTTLIAVPQERFSNVANWYLKTKRVFK